MKSMDEIELDLISLENEINALDPEITKKIIKELNFLKRDIENLEDDITDLKENWDLVDEYYDDLKECMERF